MRRKTISLESAKEYIDQLDLSYIIEAMCAPHYPLPRWTLSDAQHCCQLYKNFLFLQKKFSPESLVPTRSIDEFWHNHILYTRNYIQDCLNIFGHYMHHAPTSPLDGPEVLVNGFLRTKALYLAEFGKELLAIK